MASRDIFKALDVADFRWLWIGSLGSSFAMNMQIVARGWLVYTLTGSAMDLAWVTLSFMVPTVVFSLWGGVLADRVPKRPVIVLAQALNCAATLVMAAIIFSEQVTLWHFIGFGFFNGTVLALSMPARQAFVPELIPDRLIFTAMALNTSGWNLSRILGPDRLIFTAMALNTSGWNLSRILGPALAGLLIALMASGDTSSTFGVGVVYLMIAFLYLLAAATTLLVKKPGNVKVADGKSPITDMIDGLRYVRANPPVLGLILLSIVPFLFGMPINTLLPAFNEDVLGGGPDNLGFLMSAMGVGAILGSLMLASMGDLRGKRNWLVGTCVGWGVFMVAFGSAQVMWLAVLLVAVIGWLSAWNMSLNRGMLQMQVEPTMRGRIMSIDMMSHGLMPIGVIPISFIADRYSVAVALEVAGVLFVLSIVALAAFTSSVRRVDENMRQPANQATAPPLPESGRTS